MIQYICFHAFKHHLKFCWDWTIHNKNTWRAEMDKILKSLGHSCIDMYIGTYSVVKIKEEISSILIYNHIHEKEYYRRWIQDNGGYKELGLSDNSTWTLRYLEQEQYIHIHPSRYSNHTKRMKANVLKTVICMILFDEDWMNINYVRINELRMVKLHLSPIDEKRKHAEILKIIKLFSIFQI